MVVLDSETDLHGSRRSIYHGWSKAVERRFDSGATLANAPSTLERIYVEGPRIDEHLLAAIDRNEDGQLGGANLKNVRDFTADQDYFYLQNRHGSTMALSDANRSDRVLEYLRYSVSGVATVLGAVDSNSDGLEDSPLDLIDNAVGGASRFSAEFANPFLFAGRRFDDHSGLHFYRHRYYETTCGRFTSRDPIDYATSLNLSQYARNAPTEFTDPYGLYEQDVHFTLTHMLGFAVGLSDCLRKVGVLSNEAYKIAWADWQVDENLETWPRATLGWLKSAPFRFGKDVWYGGDRRWLFHFRAYGGTKVEENSRAARTTALSGIMACNPFLFGIGLHILQDSLAHAGYSWRIGHTLNPTAPDRISTDPAKAMRMAQETYKLLQAYAENCCCATGFAWSSVGLPYNPTTPTFAGEFDRARKEVEPPRDVPDEGWGSSGDPSDPRNLIKGRR
ncbi:MAG: RHS repeat-associated core domain-containing protein [Verrucomicrobiae bacterium]|nr:RHS repeat-associated core domain-containing protein [Verrucomicrobiae bacterium]